jgi:ribonuclease BN (tRNA processing enzyme)
VKEVVFIGTSDAFGAGGRRQSAVLLRSSSGTVLVDCGTTTNTGLSDLAIEREEIDAMLISHFHGDHFAGIPLMLLAAQYADRRTRPMLIAGPPGIEQRVRLLADAMGHPMEDKEWSYPIHFQELHAGSEQEVGPTSVRTFETQHQSDAHPQGYRITSGGRSISYSGDTGWFDGLPDIAAGSELFICECTYRASHLDFHLNLELLEERHAAFDCGRILLTHLGEQMAERRSDDLLETADDGLALKL